MTRRWFYSTRGQGQPHGPVEAGQLRDLAHTGQLRPNDLIWPEGSDAGAAVPAEAALCFANAEAGVSAGHDRQPSRAAGSLLRDGVRLSLQDRSLQEAYDRALAALNRWADLRINRPLLLSADRAALRRDVAIQSILLPLRRFGPAVVDCFWQDLEAMLQQRHEQDALDAHCR